MMESLRSTVRKRCQEKLLGQPSLFIGYVNKDIFQDKKLISDVIVMQYQKIIEYNMRPPV